MTRGPASGLRGIIRRCPRDKDRKSRPPAGRGIDLDFMVEQRGKPANDRQTQAHALAAMTGARRRPDRTRRRCAPARRGAMPTPESHDVDRKRRAPRRRTPSTAPPRSRVAHGIRRRDWRGCARAARGSLSTQAACGNDAQARTALCAAPADRTAASSSREQRRKGKWRAHRRDRTGIELGDIHQRAEQALQRLDRCVDTAHEVACLRRAHLRRQCGAEQSHRVQRLPQVVAGRGEELRLAAIRGLGGGARAVRRARSVPGARR